MSMDYKEPIKIILTGLSEDRIKYEVVKLILIMKLLKKWQKKRNYLRLLTEFELDNGVVCNIYFENASTKEAIVYEIFYEQKEKPRTLEVPFVKTRYVGVNLNNLSNNIQEISSQLEEYIF